MPGSRRTRASAMRAKAAKRDDRPDPAYRHSFTRFIVVSRTTPVHNLYWRSRKRRRPIGASHKKQSRCDYLSPGTGETPGQFSQAASVLRGSAGNTPLLMAGEASPSLSFMASAPASPGQRPCCAGEPARRRVGDYFLAGTKLAKKVSNSLCGAGEFFGRWA